MCNHIDKNKLPVSGTYCQLVTVGIPTYNRGNFIKQSVESVLNQTYSNLEIIISDNSSLDQTRIICEHYKNHDSRINYIQQKINLGPAPNFLEVLRHATGQYFMWLGDDDWIDANYIEECMKVLLRDKDVIIAAGCADYYRGETKLYPGTVMNLLDDSPVIRVTDYFAQVRHNSVFYGVMRIDDLRKVALRNVLGGDQLMVAAMAFLGKVKCVETTRMHRRRGGESQDNKKMVKSMSLGFLDRYFPRISVVCNIFADITRKQNVYGNLTAGRRYQLALICGTNAFVRKIKHIFRRDKNSE